ncbi:expressed unknown protein [Seminavis robusta]|uniref:Uncharacterized protein n=1 Tax=Seminavis robusta TaxID=568900 RepID=A0A9N8HUB2_9STRA|nr:expressed unknown protein [Seminavis robusta]|eukprot:Sro1364_g266430.1 n/a (134) ;mRNA; r:6011-6412
MQPDCVCSNEFAHNEKEPTLSGASNKEHCALLGFSPPGQVHYTVCTVRYWSKTDEVNRRYVVQSTGSSNDILEADCSSSGEDAEDAVTGNSNDELDREADCSSRGDAEDPITASVGDGKAPSLVGAEQLDVEA